MNKNILVTSLTNIPQTGNGDVCLEQTMGVREAELSSTAISGI